MTELLAATSQLGGAPVGEGAPLLLSRVAANTLLEYLLSFVDGRVQALYRAFFEAHPPPAHLPLEERLTLLEAVRGDAESVIDSVDWDRMADWLNIEGGPDYCLHLLSTLAIPPRIAVLRMSYHCNAACRHCYNESGPERREPRLALSRMLDIVRQMPASYMDTLHLTGGEPFLHFDDVLTLIAEARAVGLRKVSVFTNGYWAKDPDIARRRLARLREAGFMATGSDAMEVSTGVAHGAFIEIARIGTLVDAYHREFGRKPAVKCELWEGHHPDDEAVRAALAAAGLAEHAEISYRLPQTVGRVRGLKAHPPSDRGPCKLGIIAFDPDGSARPCCGMNYQNDGILISQGKDDSLPSLIRRMVNDPAMQALNQDRPGALFEQVPGAPGPEGFGGVCDWCRHALPPVGESEPLRARLFSTQRFYPFQFRRQTLRRQALVPSACRMKRPMARPRVSATE